MLSYNSLIQTDRQTNRQTNRQTGHVFRSTQYNPGLYLAVLFYQQGKKLLNFFTELVKWCMPELALVEKNTTKERETDRQTNMATQLTSTWSGQWGRTDTAVDWTAVVEVDKAEAVIDLQYYTHYYYYYYYYIIHIQYIRHCPAN